MNRSKYLAREIGRNKRPSRKRHWKTALALILCAFSTAGMAQVCSNGEKQLHAGEPCIPAVLFNYLYRLENSGGGKI